MKRVLSLVLVALMVLSLMFVGAAFSAPPRSNHPRLYAVAIHSLLGSGGICRNILILEEDDFGRAMFAFAGSTTASDNFGFTILAVLIGQRPGRRHAYFYDGINFILHEIDMTGARSSTEFLDETFVMAHFSEEQLEQLKVENSWNEELNPDRFFRVRAGRGGNPRGPMTTVSDRTWREAAESAFSFGLSPRARVPSRSLTMDSNGNVIHFVRGERFDWGTERMIYFPPSLFLFDRNGNWIEETGFMELEPSELWDYRERLLEFKEANGWSFYHQTSLWWWWNEANPWWLLFG